MTRVLKINGDGTATISTEGLYLVLARGKVIHELLERSEAEAIVKTFKNCNPDDGHRVEILDYAEAYRRKGLRYES